MPRKSEFWSEQVHPSVFLADGAVVRGDVTIGEQSSVWFNAVIRGDTTPIRIGQRTNIQDGCILHADPGFPCEIGNGVTLGHGAIIHGAVLADDVMIGMGAILLNGAQIGEGSIVAAGALVPEGREIPPRSLVVGVPGKVRGTVSEEQLARIHHAAEHYVAAAEEYKSQ